MMSGSEKDTSVTSNSDTKPTRAARLSRRKSLQAASLSSVTSTHTLNTPSSHHTKISTSNNSTTATKNVDVNCTEAQQQQQQQQQQLIVSEDKVKSSIARDGVLIAENASLSVTNAIQHDDKYVGKTRPDNTQKQMRKDGEETHNKVLRKQMKCEPKKDTSTKDVCDELMLDVVDCTADDGSITYQKQSIIAPFSRQMDLDTLALALYEIFIEELSVDECFRMHRQARTGVITQQSTNGQNSVDIFAQQPSRLPDTPFKCSNCARLITFSKYAPHLEKCTGKGRAAARPARQARAKATAIMLNVNDVGEGEHGEDETLSEDVMEVDDKDLDFVPHSAKA